MSDNNHPAAGGPTEVHSDAEYPDGLSAIVGRLHDSVGSALATAIDEHRALMSSVLVSRLMAPLSAVGMPQAQAAQPVAEARAVPKVPTTGRRTARELVLEAIARAPAPISFNDVKVAVVAAGGSELGAHKVRTDLLRKGAIVRQRGLYAITDAGRAMRAAYG